MRAVVRAEGLEPPRLSSLEPKSSASTSSATPARARPIPPGGAAYSMVACWPVNKIGIPRSLRHGTDRQSVMNARDRMISRRAVVGAGVAAMLVPLLRPAVGQGAGVDGFRTLRARP